MSKAGPCLLIVGAGYSGAAIAERASEFRLDGGEGGVEALERKPAAEPLEVIGTRTSPEGVAQLAKQGIEGRILDANPAGRPAAQAEISPDLMTVLERMTHLIICVGPSRESPLDDPVHRLLAPVLEQSCPRWRWMAYLSTIGVYGDHQGQWIDESASCNSLQTRSIMRREAEVAWQNTASNRGVPASVLRLSGIYGPSRNAVEDALAGRGRRLVKPKQVFNRIHVDDIATATLKTAERLHDGVLNLTDNAPAASHVVVEFAHRLIDREPPPVIDFETAELSPMARSFYGENKRVDNTLSRESLGMSYRYPTYREGLSAEAARLGVGRPA